MDFLSNSADKRATFMTLPSEVSAVSYSTGFACHMSIDLDAISVSSIGQSSSSSFCISLKWVSYVSQKCLTVIGLLIRRMSCRVFDPLTLDDVDQIIPLTLP